MNLLIVTHFSDEFLKTTHQFYDYFLRVKKLPERRIYFYSQETKLRGKSLPDRLKEMVAKDEPLVIYYGRHGLKFGWRFSINYTVNYEEIISALKDQKKPIIFVNDCCYAMALKDHLSQLSCRHMLLGLAPKTLEGYESLVPSVIECWKENRPADPRLWVENKEQRTPFILEKYKELLRCGVNLDYLCYPNK